MYLRGEAFIIKETADALGDKGALSPDFLYVQRQGEAPNKADIVLIWVASLHQWGARRTLQQSICWSSVSFWFSLYKLKTRAIAPIRYGSPRFLLLSNLFRIARTHSVIIQQMRRKVKKCGRETGGNQKQPPAFCH